MSSSWAYYDFDKNWSDFLRVWKTPAIQEIVTSDMQSFTYPRCCIKDYIPGSPLWWYYDERDSYWDDKIDERTEKHVQMYNSKKNFEQTMNRLGFKNSFQRCWEEISQEYEPKEDSIDSFIFSEGNSVLRYALCETCELLFPSSKIMVVGDDRNDYVILLIEEKLVFDIFAFYYAKYDACPLYLDCQRRFSLSGNTLSSGSWIDVFLGFNHTKITYWNFELPDIPVDSVVYELRDKVLQILDSTVEASHIVKVPLLNLSPLENFHLWDFCFTIDNVSILWEDTSITIKRIMDNTESFVWNIMLS